MKYLRAKVITIAVLCIVVIGVLIGILVRLNKDGKEKEVLIEDAKNTDDLTEVSKDIDDIDDSEESEDIASVDDSDAQDISEAENKEAWNVTLELNVKQPVRMAAFLNESFGITGGFSGAGKTCYTTNGGESWTINEGSGGCIFGVEIVDSNIVWICGKMTGMSFRTPGGLRMSTDGGKTLGDTLDFKTGPSTCPLSFLDDMRGWVSQDGVISETRDGGLNFNEIKLPEGLGKIAGIGVYEAGDDFFGSVLSGDGILYITKDHGESWTDSALPIKEGYDGYKIGKFEGASTAIRFFDKDNALAVMSLTGKEEPLIIGFRTSDGGMTWSDEIIGKGQGSVYLSPDGCYVTGYYNKNVTVYRYGMKDHDE
ncbi:MAG: hypothetical protein GX129_06715 [Clostridiales bacterium]|nr:hypothetical protein [Clostridiales bacterium]